MKILVLANFPPYVLGGAENQVARLVDAWLVLGHQVDVAGFRIPHLETVRGEYRLQLYHLHIINSLGRLGRALSYCVSLFIFLLTKGHRYDVIYSRGLGDAAISVSVAKAIRLCKIPLIACPINSKGKGDTNFIKSIPGWRYIVKILNKHCNAINIIASDIKIDLAEIGINIPQLCEIPNGIPIRPIMRQNQESCVRKLIFTGRLNQQKGLDILIKSLANLRNEGYSFQCNIVGDGPLYYQLAKKIQEYSIHDKIHVIGSIPSENIRNMLLDADVFIMPSRYEGMSNSVLEAMEAEMPVIVTRCGGIDHYIDQKNGWVCAPGNEDDLTRCLREMLETPTALLNEMGINNRNLVKNTFSIEQIASKNIDFFLDVLQHQNN